MVGERTRLDFLSAVLNPLGILQLIFSVFKTLTDQQVTVELKNDLCITGVLKSVDQYVSLQSLRRLEVLKRM